ncbi:MAG: Sec-independent protein translocase subunit TatA [Dermatophilaceae bacterium]
MEFLGAPELLVIALVVFVLFGWKRLPDAARSLGRSARIFKAEVQAMKDEDAAAAGPEPPPQNR